MIIIKLWGGLGNQLFQYAYGYQLAKKKKEKIVLDVSWFDNQHGPEDHRDPEILKFNIKYDRVEKTCEKYKGIKLFNSRQFNWIIRIPPFACYKVNGFNYLKESRSDHFVRYYQSYNRDNTYLDGYWQCPRYFDEVEEDLRRMYQIKEQSLEVKEIGIMLKKSNSVAIHVRRGDYPKKRIWYSKLLAISDDYYRQAVQYMKDRVPEGRYYLFSNDISNTQEMIRDVLGEKATTFSSSDMKLTANDEWYLMSCCQNQIIGNSTFSWWSAYINDNKDKIVCAPDGYMGNDDILPENWVTFKV